VAAARIRGRLDTVTGVAVGDIPDDELARHWHEIVRATARVQRLLDRDLEAAGLTAPWFPALDLLLAAPGHRLPMSTLARELAMTSGGGTKLAGRMAADGLIDRRGASDDRRVVHAALTPAGLRAARQARTAYLEALRRRLAGVSGPEFAAVAAVLTRLEGADGRDQLEVADQLAGERDPALPDRRGRGRRRGPSAY
jgi:DNA-binding MarR family transcriptional regulator